MAEWMMSTDISMTWTDRRRPPGQDVCPLQFKCLRTDGQNSDLSHQKKSLTACSPRTGSSLLDKTHQKTLVPQAGGVKGDEVVVKETSEFSEDELGRLDIDLDRKSKQHNLTSSNVRAILHELITHEHVVAMMKAAIRDTQNCPMFEPKMTRSRLKQAVQEGQPINWSLAAVKTVKPPQFVDIDLEDEEDSSDEEYCPGEEEEEDTADETFLSDAESLSSPLRMNHVSQCKTRAEQQTHESHQRFPGHVREQAVSSTCAPQPPLKALAESSFLERLNAVEEELNCGQIYTFGQSLDRKDDDVVDEGCLAFRTRSKLPLINIPLGQLEAELLAPDISADMYDLCAVPQEEDRHWAKWLQGLMAPDNEEEADDDDDPEYNFLDDMDEPDLEDYRTDRAVQITKREVNELLEELFDVEEEEVANEGQEQAEQEDEAEAPSQTTFNVLQDLRLEAPLAGRLSDRQRTLRKMYEATQHRRALQDTTNHHCDNVSLKDTPGPQLNTATPVLVLPSIVYPALHLDLDQKLQLQQQMQQHVQLLTQVHLLSRHINALKHEACITKYYLEELQQLASCREKLSLPSSFRVWNLQGALTLLQEVEHREEPRAAPAVPAVSRRWLPRMNPATNSHAFPLLPADVAWLFATRSIFLYPELLPVCSLDPSLHSQHQRNIYTTGEDGLIVLGLKHFEGAVQQDQLICSYLLCKNRWNLRKHIREMSSTRAPQNSIIKLFLTHQVVPPLPLACSRVYCGDQRPPVDKNTANMPNWLKNSQRIIQKTRTGSICYPASLPAGCTLRLHPYYLNKTSRQPPLRHRRLFTLAHNASLLPLAKAPGDRQVEKHADVQRVSYLPPPPSDVTLLSDSPALPGAFLLAPSPVCVATPLAAVPPGLSHPVCGDIIKSTQVVSRHQTVSCLPPLPCHSNPDTAKPSISCSAPIIKPGFFFLQTVLTPAAPPTAASHDALREQVYTLIKGEHTEVQTSTRPHSSEKEETQVKEKRSMSPSLLNLIEKERRSCGGTEAKEHGEDWSVVGVDSLNGKGATDGGDEDGSEEGGTEQAGEGGEEEVGSGGEGEPGGEEEQEGQSEDGGEERKEEGDKDKDEDQDRQGEDEEEDDFDDLTQDEDEEEVMSSASEESVLSVPELQETMKQLTWLAAERRLCADGDSEEDHSPTSPGSQEEEEEEEEGPKGEESREGRIGKAGGEEDETPSGEGVPRGGGRCPGRGRGRSRPIRGLRRNRQERRSKDAAKLLLLFDENILDNDPHREIKDVAFAQSYLSRVCEALQNAPGQIEEFVSLLNEFEQLGEGREVLFLFRKLRCILRERTDLLRDFAAFLRPEQALQCGLFEEQQAFERSRRFLRQLEISFEDNPSHYQKIIKALQTGPDLTPNNIHELKAQMATLLKGHIHLQAELWVFFDDLRPPPARPEQFEDAHWPEEGGGGLDGGDGFSQMSGGAIGGFEEVTLPELEEEEEGQKIQSVPSRRQRRKIDAHRNCKDCDWSNKHWPCSCHDTKIHKHRRKGCCRCQGNKASRRMSREMKSPLYPQISSIHCGPGDKYLDQKGDDDCPHPDAGSASWEGSFRLPDEKEEEEEEEEELDDEYDEDEEERKNTDKEQSPAVKRRAGESRREEALEPSSVTHTSSCVTSSTSTPSTLCSSANCSTSSVTSTIFTSRSVTSSLCTSSVYTSPFTSSTSPYLCTHACTPSTSSLSAPAHSSPPADLPVCAKNISLTASGEKVILWTREADRVILTTCQQEGANQNTFQAISNLLGNKTPSEVSQRFRDLMSLFRTAARQTSSEDEAPPTM